MGRPACVAGQAVAKVPSKANPNDALTREAGDETAKGLARPEVAPRDRPMR